jgi:hypothetical protein
VVIPGFENEVITLEAHPGDVTGTVRALAHAAMAMCAPFAWQDHLKSDGAAQATAHD